ncbi:MAG: hypothetical protein ACRDTC_01400 [Pseudonocardiaceae bacterium]
MVGIPRHGLSSLEGGDQADNFHVTLVLTPNEGKEGTGLKQKQAEKAEKVKEESAAAARFKGFLAERTAARFDTSGGSWRSGGGTPVAKDVSVHFHGDEEGLYKTTSMPSSDVGRTSTPKKTTTNSSVGRGRSQNYLSTNI